MKPSRIAVAALGGVLIVTAGGCPRPVKRLVFDPIPMAGAVRLVNQNISKIRGTLRASGSVDGHYTSPDGRKRSYHVDGILFYLAPSYVRFDLKMLGQRQFLIGSNTTHYWYYSREEDTFHCSRRGEGGFPAEMPVRPDQIVEALGLTWIPAVGLDSRGARLPEGPFQRMVQRVVDEYQQILFLVGDEQGETVLEKEYWLDRYAPRLVRRVVFRDSEGVVQMESLLDDYRVLADDDLWLPYELTADWPATHSRLRFRIKKWSLVDAVGPESIQFAPPPVCDGP